MKITSKIKKPALEFRTGGLTVYWATLFSVCPRNEKSRIPECNIRTRISGQKLYKIWRWRGESLFKLVLQGFKSLSTGGCIYGCDKIRVLKLQGICALFLMIKLLNHNNTKRINNVHKLLAIRFLQNMTIRINFVVYCIDPIHLVVFTSSRILFIFKRR